MKKLFRYRSTGSRRLQPAYIKVRKLKLAATATTMCFCALSLCLADKPKYIQLSAVTHIHSSFSHDGVKSLEYWAQEAEKAGIDVLIPTDTALARWEYGVWPLRGIIKKVVEKPSVLSLGPENYLNAIEYFRKKYPSVLIIPGIETAPAYYWDGSIFSGHLTLTNWNRHMLVIGLDKPDYYKKLPVASNKSVGKWKNVVNLYKGDLGYKPYQTLINYVVDRGGLIFWAHPEAPNWAKPTGVAPGVYIQTKPYPEAVLNTDNYTGFGYWWEGSREVGGKGGKWDEALLQYVDGKRKRPPWAIAELDIGTGGHSDVKINTLRMILWAKGKTKPDVMEAISGGRFYITSSTDFSLKEFYITSSDSDSRVYSGGHFDGAGSIYIHMRLIAHGNQNKKLNIAVVRNGKLWKNLEAGTASSFKIQDTVVSKEPVYYRVVVNEGLNCKLVTNPVFVNVASSLRTHSASSVQAP